MLWKIIIQDQSSFRWVSKIFHITEKNIIMPMEKQKILSALFMGKSANKVNKNWVRELKLSDYLRAFIWFTEAFLLGVLFTL